MGRLDEAAKVKVVELRKAGLSFRKIKAELERENIQRNLNVQTPITRTASSVACSTGAVTAPLTTRRRVSPSPSTNPMLAARKRILDKALSHRIKSFQQMASLLRRDQTTVQGAGLRNPLQQPSNTYNLNERGAIEKSAEGLGGTSALRFSVPRPSAFSRSPQQPPPRVGIRLPSQSVGNSAPGMSNLRLLNPPSSHSTTNHKEGNCSPQQTVQESRVRAIVQDQIQTLSSEVHSLAGAVKMLVEQQSRLEREQAQQTNIQKQILSTLQTMSSKMGCCGTVQHQQKCHSPAALKSTSFDQDSFACSQSTYTQCSESQPSFNSIDTLETVEPFKLPELSPTSMNGFAACSSTETLPLITSPLYAQQNTQTHNAGFTQSYVSAYSQANNSTFADNKLINFPHSCAIRSFQDCNISTEAVLSMSDSVQDQVNNIKVEGP
ncbi:unnamed protein product [Knipowitschia caucasica]